MSKKELMFDLIEAQQNSGLSNIDYCKQNNLSLSVYNYWKKEYNKQHSKHEEGFFVRCLKSYIRHQTIRIR